MLEEQPRFAPNGNKLPERLPIGHRLVDTTKQQWIIGPSIGCGGFGDIYLTKPYNETSNDLMSQEEIIRDSRGWENVIKFEHFSGPLFAEINFYIRCARKETIEEYMSAKKLKHLGMPRFVASGIYDPLRNDNPLPICKPVISNIKGPAIKRGRQTKKDQTKAINGNGLVNGKQKKINLAQSKEKKYRFLVLQRFGDDLQKIWTRANEKFDMKSAFNIALKVIDTLEYIHSHGYVHADVKASNLLIGGPGGQSFQITNEIEKSNNLKNGNSTRKKNSDQSSVDSGNGVSIQSGGRRSSRTKKPVALKRNRPISQTNDSSLSDCEDESNSVRKSKDCINAEDQIYLIDFGLVERFYSKDGTHRENVEDQRRANNGTVEFSSRDAHIGAFSRRSDLESLAYNLLYWVSRGRLPWTNVLKDHQLVEASKRWYMDNLEIFVNYCFNVDAQPIDPLRLLRGLDPSATGNGSKSSSTNGRTNGRHTNNNNNATSNSTTNGLTSVSTTSSKASKASLTKGAKETKTNGKSKIIRASSTTTTSTSSPTPSSLNTHDSIMCTALYDFLSYITKLQFEDEPDYYLLKSILTNAIGDGSSSRTARKRGGSSLKKVPPKLPKCENPTPAMREILRKMSLGSKK